LKLTQRSAAGESDIVQRLHDVMAAVFGIEASEIRPDASSATIAEWDSVRHLQLMLALEDEFGIQFDMDELATLRSVPLIRDRLARGPHG
jgi:acyl carrier protein